MFQWNFTKLIACSYNQNNKINMPRFEQSATKKKKKKNLKNKEKDRLRTLGSYKQLSGDRGDLFKTIETEFDSFIFEQSAKKKKKRGKR
jgi:hypothetical protein